MTFSVHEELMKYYLREHGRDPLPGYAPISLEQIQRTDREIFRRMAEETRSGLGLTIGGEYPLDPIVKRILAEPRIVALMMPLPSAKSTVAGDSGATKRSADVAELNRLREEVKRLKTRGQSSSSGSQGGGPKGGSKGKKSDKKAQKFNDKQSNRFPGELKGKKDLHGLIDGKRICFDYNMKKSCHETTNANGCHKGHHICMRCGGNHPQHYEKCPKK
jgi:hypothetical protein